ncbi:MAG: thioesterase family protein [Deltaproteobacteria bacterium]|nr:thioesterase family protein [Deltaproteobacteria bacterium]
MSHEPSRFDRDTACTLVAPGVYDARVDRGWWVARGPNGGYVAALLVRAMEQAVADPARQLRSVTIHYVRPPREGAARVETRVERVGGSLTTLSARLLQGDSLQALALAAFSKPRTTPEMRHAAMPEVAPPEALEPRRDPKVTIHERYEQRWAIGPRYFEGARGREALTGGWIRLAEGQRPIDGTLLAALADAWPPAVFASTELPMALGGVPTVDLTVHIRAALPLPADFVLAMFRTREVSGGFLEEDGELWSRDGRLLAHSRQLGVVL